MSILDDIDKVTAGLCPCGADPAPGSAYCSDDCRPTHISRDTDTRMAGPYATPMRWRPDLVTESDDTGLTPMCEPFQRGPYTAQVFHRDGTDRIHLRLDDGHRYVGVDIDCDPGAGHTEPGTLFGEAFAQGAEAWRRLERELGDPRRTVPREAGADALLVSLLRSAALDRFCRPCLRYGEPRAGYRFRGQRIEFTTAGPAPIAEAIEECQVCPHCGEPYPGPPLTLAVSNDIFSGIRLTLTGVANGRTYQQARFVSARQLTSAVNVRGMLRIILDHMEASLLRSLANEEGAANATARRDLAAGQLVTTDDVIVGDPSHDRPSWHRHPSAPLEPPDVEAYRQMVRRMGDQFEAYRQYITERFGPALQSIANTLTRAGVVAPPPPTDPMQRALEHRRNRNTGPAPAPLDPRRRRHR